jgi:hypothetical protein
MSKSQEPLEATPVEAHDDLVTVITGTAIRPVLAISSSRAAASSATFFAVKSIPRDERNSFAA